ncbi:MAG: CPBP family glutamic-type intramembrane protease [Myxococcota bacterium]
MIEPGLLFLTVAALAVTVCVHRREAFRFRWRPNRHTWAAICAGLLVVGLSGAALLVPDGSPVGKLIIFGGIFTVCGSVIPWVYVLLVEGGGPAELGCSRNLWKTSLAISVMLGAFGIYFLMMRVDLGRYDPLDIAKASYFLSAGGLFELFLYYGFIHLRLRQAFGVLPAIFGSAAIYSLWHIGTELPLHDDPLEALLMLFVVGLYYHSVFSLTRNLLIIFPFFFLSGVMIDFLAGLDLPPLVTGDMVWVTFAWMAMLLTPVLLLAAKRRNSAG